MDASIYDFIIDINSRMEALMQRIGIFMGIDLVCVFKFADGKQTLMSSWKKVQGGHHEDGMLKDFNIIENLNDVFLRLKSLMFYLDPPENLPQEQSEYLKKRGIASAIYIPIQNKGNLWGCLSCMSTKEKRAWKSEELSALLNESIDLSSYVFLMEMLTELKEADEQLSLMLNLVTEGIVVTDENFLITSISGRIADLGGFVQEELLGRTVWEFIYPDDHERARSNMELAEKGLRSVDIYRLLLKSGAPVLTRISTKLMIKNGRKNGYVFLLVNVEAPTATDMRLSEYQEYMNHIGDLIWMTDMELLFTYVSPSVAHLLGYSVEEAMKLNAGLTYSRSTERKLAEAFTKGLEAAASRDGKFRTVIDIEQFRRDGAAIYGKMNIALTRDLEGTPKGFIGVTHFRTDEPFPEKMASN